MKNTYFLVALSFSVMAIHGADNEVRYNDINMGFDKGYAPSSAFDTAENNPISDLVGKHVVQPVDAYVVQPFNKHVVQPVSNNIPKPVVEFAQSAQKRASDVAGYAQKSVSDLLTAAQIRLGLVQPVVEKPLSVWEKCKNQVSKAWNAEIFGYAGAGKYAIVAASAATILSVYAMYALTQKTLEDQVIALVQKAQKNPNVILQELPVILAQCDNDDVRIEVLEYVLSRVVITSEIAAAFNLQN